MKIIRLNVKPKFNFHRRESRVFACLRPGEQSVSRSLLLFAQKMFPMADTRVWNCPAHNYPHNPDYSLWLVERDHVTWILASDWSDNCPHNPDCPQWTIQRDPVSLGKLRVTSSTPGVNSPVIIPYPVGEAFIWKLWNFPFLVWLIPPPLFGQNYGRFNYGIFHNFSWRLPYCPEWQF